MKKDLLDTYTRNHLSVFYLPILVVTLFLWLSFYIKGYPETDQLITGVILLGIAGVFYTKQRFLYKKILAQKDINQQSIFKLTLKVLINKIGYAVPWFLIVFVPYQTDYIFDHVLGFIFIFLSIGAYVSLSHSCMALFLSDIAIQVFVASTILFINKDSIESPYIFAALLIFTAYAFLIGKKLYNSAIALINKNHQLEQAAEDAKRANRAKSDFLSMISHEIRTPMHGIMSTIEHLYETSLSKEQKESLQVVTRCSKTLLTMLNDVLDISKIEAKKIKIENIDFNLHKIIHETLDIVKFSASDKNITLTCNINPNTPEFINADPIRFQQVILNFLNNAIKFTDNGNVILNIFTEDTSNFPQIKVEVIDTGIGIKPENQKILFERFEQVGSPTTRKHGGTGLGLSIAKELVSLMNGKIGVISEHGSGSKFWFNIPYVTADKTLLLSKKDKKKQIINLPEGLRILVAEDNKINQKSIQRILSEKTSTLDIVENGKDVLNKIKENTYDLIFMDLNMPIMNGIEATYELKHQSDNLLTTPIVGLTATTEENMISNFYDAGISDHITKPFSKNDLLQSILKNIENNNETSDLTNHKLQEIYDDFGIEFYQSFIKDSLDELNRLLSLLNKSYQAKTYQPLYEYAHDICAVSGNIGMSQTYQKSKIIEKSCSKKEFDTISNLLTELNSIFQQEIALIEKFTPQ